MTEISIAKLRYILARNCLWLDLLDEQILTVEEIVSGPLIIGVTSTAIVLRVKRDYKGYRKNRLIKISERQLDDAIKYMINDSKFKDRYDNGSLTVMDVEELIRLATYGTLSLDLFEY